MKHSSAFETRTLDQLTIDDEPSFDHVVLYADLKDVLKRSGYAFRVLPKKCARWDRAVFLNLTFWGASERGDVLVDTHLPADVVAHVAWHHLAAAALSDDPAAPLSADALFLGESIASAFDLYLVGRLLGHSPNSSFLETQVSAMADAVSEAGLSERAFASLLEGIAHDPDRAFEDLRELLFDATTSLVRCASIDDAAAILSQFDKHRFGALLHHYELSNWVLYTRAYAKSVSEADPRVREVDSALRKESDPLHWLFSKWNTI